MAFVSFGQRSREYSMRDPGRRVFRPLAAPQPSNPSHPPSTAAVMPFPFPLACRTGPSIIGHEDVPPSLISLVDLDTR